MAYSDSQKVDAFLGLISERAIIDGFKSAILIKNSSFFI